MNYFEYNAILATLKQQRCSHLPGNAQQCRYCKPQTRREQRSEYTANVALARRQAE